MEKKILVAVDDSTYSRKAIEYAAQMKEVITDLSFILFNMQPTISDYLLHDSKRDAKASAALKEVIAKNEKTSKQLLENYKSKMIKKGVDEKSIDLVTQPRAMGAAKDILLYAKHAKLHSILRLHYHFQTHATSNALNRHPNYMYQL